jgi:hypothetical protein
VFRCILIEPPPFSSSILLLTTTIKWCCAIFRSIGQLFQLYARVESAPVNAADIATGSVADLACLDEHDSVVLAVEVKDRELLLRHVQDKLPALRERGVRELLFVITSGAAAADAESIEDTIDREFVTDQNVYVTSFQQFLRACLVLFRESGRRHFLVQVGESIDEIRADLTHRQAWRALLEQL